MKLIKELYSLSGVSCILGLVNSRNKRVYLVRSTDALTTAARVLRLAKSRNNSYKLLRKEYKQLDVVILETVTDANSVEARLRYKYWYDYYKHLGYTFYKEYQPVEYTPKIYSNDEYLLEVRLVSKGRSEVLVGVFNTLDLANQFIAQYYPSGVPIYKIHSHDSVTASRAKRRSY